MQKWFVKKCLETVQICADVPRANHVAGLFIGRILWLLPRSCLNRFSSPYQV